MDLEQKKKALRERDRSVRALTKDGKFRIISIRNTSTAKTAQKRHNLSLIPAVFLAKTMGAAMMMASLLKGEERIIIDIEGDGSLQKIFAEAIQTGEIRGFARYTNEVNLSLPSSSDYLGEGTLRVTKIMYDRPEPITSIIPLQKTDIQTDIAGFFSRSEQIPTAVILDVDFNENGFITESAGFLVQAMPGATISEINAIMNDLKSYQKLTKLYEEATRPEEIIAKIINKEFDVLRVIPVDFFCRCSKDGFLDKLLTLSYEEIKDMKEMKQNELICQYCNAKYYIDEEDFDKLLIEKKAVSN